MEELYEFAGSEAIPFVLFAGGSLTASEAHELWTAAQDNRLPLVLVEAALEEAGMSISAEVKGGRVLRHTDGGTRWLEQYDDPDTYLLRYSEYIIRR